jgi:two-component system response regulator DesR
MNPMGPARSSLSTSAPGDRPSVTGAGAHPNDPGVAIQVLVIDDDPRVRAALSQTISLEPDLVVLAVVADTTAALASAENAELSVALVDVLLPDDTTGLALVRQLAHRPGCAVVAISVHPGLRRAALAAGAAFFVEKSGDIDAVLHAVRNASSRRRP